MNLDDFAAFNKIDPQDMYSQIESLPNQLQQAWDLGHRLEIPAWTGLRQVLIAGMGGSAIGADLLAAYVADQCPLPIHIHRDYELPAWVKGPETLLIVSSHSGNTEETLSAYKAGISRDCRCLVVSTGGELARLAVEAGSPVWRFNHKGQPRAAVGYSFGLLLASLFRLGLISDPTEALKNAIRALREQQKSLAREVPTVQNPAKRFAGQLIGRWVTVIGAGMLSPVARRWKGQISEIAKAWGQFEFLPEADHNTLAGLLNPEDLLSRMVVLFLRSASDHPNNRLRSDLTRRAFMLEGLNTDFIDAQGETPLAQLWTSLHFGDYVAYYLAMAYNVDPTPVDFIENFKLEMKAAGGNITPPAQ